MKELIRKTVLSIGNPAVSASEEQIEKLAVFSENLLNHGKERGLTAFDNREDIVRELITDSLGAMSFIPEGSMTADLGSGAGIPGIPLAIVCPDSNFVMVESQNRKANWIKEQINLLGLEKRAQVLPMRIEDVGTSAQWRGKFDFVTAKALTALPSLIELSLPLLKVNGSLLAYKGIKVQEELAASANALNKLYGKFEQNFEYIIDERRRTVCIIRKYKATPKIYPRRVGVPQHNPL